MGKASSAKKVARAARAGGNRRPGQRRNLGFPFAIVLVVVLGTSLVYYARSNSPANAEPLSQASNPQDFDHWHAAYGFYLCDTFVRTEAPLGDAAQDQLGIHTHNDNVIHIHPFIDSAAGRDATMRVFLEQVGVSMDDDSLTFPDGEVWQEGETMCGDEPGRLVVAKWNDARDAADEAPNELIEDDFGGIRFRQDLEAYTIAYLPEGTTEVPARPGIIESLEGLTDVLEAPDLGGDPTVEDDPTATTVVDDGEDVTDTTEATDPTVAPDDEATTTTAAESDDTQADTDADADADEATTTTAG